MFRRQRAPIHAAWDRVPGRRLDSARRLVESVDLPTVAAWLGHERLDTVRIYHPA